MCFFRFLLCGFVFVVDKIRVLVFFFCSIGCSVILLHYIYISSCVSICCYFVPIFVFLFCCYLKLFHNVHEFCTLAIFFTITNKYWNSTIIIFISLRYSFWSFIFVFFHLWWSLWNSYNISCFNSDPQCMQILVIIIFLW
jgi:hypothetical protein